MNPLKAFNLQHDEQQELNATLNSTMGGDELDSHRKSRWWSRPEYFNQISMLCNNKITLFYFKSVTVRASTRWRSGCCCGCRRSWRGWRKGRCSVSGGRSICSFSKPWTPKTWADCTRDGRPGCEPEDCSLDGLCQFVHVNLNKTVECEHFKVQQLWAATWQCFDWSRTKDYKVFYVFRPSVLFLCCVGFLLTLPFVFLLIHWMFLYCTSFSVSKCELYYFRLIGFFICCSIKYGAPLKYVRKI